MRVKIINSSTAFLRGATRLVATLAAALSFSATAAITPPAPPVNLFVPIDLDDIFIPLSIPFAIDPDAPWYEADFNGDGILDLYVQAKDGSGTNYLFYGNAQGKYTSIGQQWKNSHLGLDWSADKASVYIADFNNDGRADIILESNANGGAVILLLTGTGGAINTVSQTWTEPTVPTPSTFTPTTTTVGATAGSFAVSPSGASTYTIPVSVPPGIGGMQPGIALSYNSQGSNGVAGLGWSIAGMSVVHRCEATLDRDGFKGGINLDNNDRLCLDGQRLVAVSAPTTSECALEYRTEMESFQRILGCGTAGSGPQYFKVYARNGAITYYGNTPDSTVSGTAKPDILTWAINRTEDTNGNYMTFSYLKADGTHTIDHIDYPGTKTTAPNRRVVFDYTAPTDADHRTDIETHYTAGVLARTTYRLKSIRSQLNNNDVHKFVFLYDKSAATGRSRLVSAQECGVGGVCFSPLVLGWLENKPSNLVSAAYAFNLTGPGLGHSNNTMGSLFGDFNGDGKSDVLRWQDAYQNNIVFLSSGNGNFTQPLAFNLANTYLGHSNNSVGSLLGDFNGDGKTDILRWWDTYQNNALFLSNGDGNFTQALAFNLANTYLGHSNNSVGSLLGDFNGDGKTDILRWWDTYQNNALFLSNGNGSFTQASAFNIKFTHLQHSNNTVGSLLGDFNGDGKTDILRWWDSYADNALFLSNGDGSFTQAGAFNIKDTYLQHSNKTVGSLLGDFNGDGKTDILRWSDTYTNNLLFLSNGDGSFTQAGMFNLANKILGHSSNTAGSLLGDFNGDGKTDILRWWEDYFPYNLLFLSNGDGSFTQSSGFKLDITLKNRYNTAGALLGDINGDGKEDVLRWSDQSNALFVSSTGADLLSTVSADFNAQTTITYKPLTDNSVYGKEKNATYPVQDVQDQTHVVSEFGVTNVSGHSRPS